MFSVVYCLKLLSFCLDRRRLLSPLTQIDVFGQVQSNITLRFNLLSIARSLVWRPKDMIANFNEG